MNLAPDNPLDDRLIQLLRHFGLARAHFAACMPRDWEGLAAKHPETISSLTLLAPMGFNILRFICNRIAATLTPKDLNDWRRTVAAGESDGSFFVAEPFHCAVGTKP